MFMVDIIGSYGISIIKQLDFRCIGAYPDIHRKSLIEIPVRENMYKRSLTVICPLSPEHICTVFGKACGIVLSEVGILRAVRRRLSNIVKACPDKLTGTIFGIPVLNNALFGVLCTPSGTAVSKRGALLIIIGKKRFFKRKMINTAALNHGCRLTSVDHPVGMLLMMLLIKPLPIVISNEL